MDGWAWLNLLGTIGFILCLMPQLARTLRRRRADDLSLPFLVLVLASSACILPYMLNEGNRVFAVAQAVNLLVWGTVLYFKLRPGPDPRPA